MPGEITLQELSPELIRYIDGNMSKTSNGKVNYRQVVLECTTESQNTFTIPSSIGFNKNVHVHFLTTNGVLFNGNDYTIDSTTIQFNDNVEGLTIGSEVLLHIFSVNDPGTISKDLLTSELVSELDNKLDNTSIVNDLTTGGVNKVLSAEQGKLLNSDINALSVDRGYLTSRWTENQDWNLIKENGVYRFNTWEEAATNVPDRSKYGKIAGQCFVTQATDAITQEVRGVSDILGSVILTRTGSYSSNSWSEWQQLATADQINILSNISGSQVFGTPDLNEWRTTGVYNCDHETSLNRPPNASWGVVHVFGLNSNCLQMYIGQNNFRNAFIRIYNNNGWTEWNKLITNDILNSVSNDMVKRIPMLSSGDLKEYIISLETSSMFYVHSDCTNTPIEGKFFICQVFCHINGAGYSDKHITIQEFRSQRQFYADSWNREAITWKEYVTNTKTIIDVPYDNGFVRTGDSQASKIVKRSDNVVEVYISVTKSDGSAFNMGQTKIGTVPSGYAPKQNVHVGGLVSAAKGTCGFFILSDGGIFIDMGQISTATGGFCTFIYSLD